MEATSQSFTSPGPPASPPSHWPLPHLNINSANLPPLPSRPIKQALLHRSALREAKLPEWQAELQCNNRLEWLGDAALFWMVSNALEHLLPMATSGDLSRLRQYITSNRTFGHLGAYYGLRAALVWGPGYLEGKRWDNEVRNTADTFEAVLGGIIRGDENNPGDFEAASRFVFALITPAVFPELAVIKKYLEEPSPWVGAEKGKRSGRVEDLLENVELFHPLASQDAPPEDTIGHCWRDQKLPGSDWTTRFYVNGREVATGIGIRRETAREAALTAYVEKMENMA